MTIRISFSEKTVRVAVEINGAIESAITELPQRPWVGLTDEEVAYFSYVLDHWTTTHIRGIEALLKAKNERL